MNSHHGQMSGKLASPLLSPVATSRLEAEQFSLQEVAGRADRKSPPEVSLRGRLGGVARATVASLSNYCRAIVMALRPRDHGHVKCFERELQLAGGVIGAVDRGLRVVPTARVVGSVSRWQHLRGDFLDRTNPRITERHLRVGQAMREGTSLPPLELYEVRLPPSNAEARPDSEYYVVDGHHRVAMARRLGQDFLDCHVVEYRVAMPSNRRPAARGE